MKKTLFILSMVLGSAAAFAQAPKTMQSIDKAEVTKQQFYYNAAKILSSPEVSSYKGSIFTKADSINPVVTFKDTNDFSIGISVPHNLQDGRGRFARIADTTEAAFDAAKDGTAGGTFGTLYNLLGGTNIFRSPSSRDGFLVVAPINTYEDQGGGTGKYNTWAQLKGTINTTTVDGVYIEFFQKTQRFNADRYFIEYRSSDTATWESIEVNVRGIEMGSNDVAYGYKKVTLTKNAANKANLQIRFRYQGNDTTIVEGTAQTNLPAGYFWMIDDVSIYPAPAKEMGYTAENFAGGLYHAIPKNLKAEPVIWSALLSNKGSDVVTNAKAKFNAGGAVLFESNEIPLLEIGKQDTLDHGYYKSSTGTEKKYLPTANAGDSYLVYTSVEDGASIPTFNSDTFNVTVTSASRYFNTWARDNNVLPTGKAFQTTFSGGIRNNTDAQGANTDGYRVGVTYRVDSTNMRSGGSGKMYINGIQIVSSTISSGDVIIDAYLTHNTEAPSSDGKRIITTFTPVASSPEGHNVVDSNIPVAAQGQNGILNPTAIDIPFGTKTTEGNVINYTNKGYEMIAGGQYTAVFVLRTVISGQFYLGVDIKGRFTNVNSFAATPVYIFSSNATDVSTPQEMPMIRLLVSDTQRDTTWTVLGINDLSVETFQLNNYPNPAKEQTTISYTLVKNANVTIEVRDVVGRIVKSIPQGNQAAERHTYVLNTADLKNGTYFYTLKANGISQTRKLLINR